MRANFNGKFLVYLISAYFGVKGTLITFLSLTQLPYFKEMGVTGSDYQAYGTASLTPWSIKGLIGALSDSRPILGCVYVLARDCIALQSTVDNGLQITKGCLLSDGRTISSHNATTHVGVPPSTGITSSPICLWLQRLLPLHLAFWQSFILVLSRPGWRPFCFSSVPLVLLRLICYLKQSMQKSW